MRQSKIALYFLGTLLVLIIAVVIYYFNQEAIRSVPFAGEETRVYVNEEYGFQFEYPVTHQVSAIWGHGNKLGIRVGPADNFWSPNSVEIFLPLDSQFGYNLSATSLEDYESDYRFCEGENYSCDVVVYSNEKTELNSYRALKQRFEAEIRYYDENMNVRRKESYPGLSLERFRYVVEGKDGKMFVLNSSDNSIESELFLDDIALTFGLVENSEYEAIESTNVSAVPEGWTRYDLGGVSISFPDYFNLNQKEFASYIYTYCDTAEPGNSIYSCENGGTPYTVGIQTYDQLISERIDRDEENYEIELIKDVNFNGNKLTVVLTSTAAGTDISVNMNYADSRSLSIRFNPAFIDFNNKTTFLNTLGVDILKTLTQEI